MSLRHVDAGHHTTRKVEDGDELARTAGLLLEAVQDETSQKFKTSAFMGLMQQLRDREVVVDGNQIVHNDGAASSTSSLDKGKGKASVPLLFAPSQGSITGPTGSLYRSADVDLVAYEQTAAVSSSEEDAYWKQENADYMKFWDDVAKNRSVPAKVVESSSWFKLQDDWDRFEATSRGIQQIHPYQFANNNPYLLGQGSSTHHHAMHHGQTSALEVCSIIVNSSARTNSSKGVLQLEALVQKNMVDASAWFQLGVKQQENEREYKAMQALERAVELDPQHLPAWLALAISYTNDSNRVGTNEAIHQWAVRNTKYQDIVHAYKSKLEDSQVSDAERYPYLLDCLLSMARENQSGEVDADIQIALAVLFNASDVCFFLRIDNGVSFIYRITPKLMIASTPP